MAGTKMSRARSTSAPMQAWGTATPVSRKYLGGGRCKLCHFTINVISIFYMGERHFRILNFISLVISIE